jgi:hypothetical protein
MSSKIEPGYSDESGQYGIDTDGDDDVHWGYWTASLVESFLQDSGKPG